MLDWIASVINFDLKLPAWSIGLCVLCFVVIFLNKRKVTERPLVTEGYVYIMEDGTARPTETLRAKAVYRLRKTTRESEDLRRRGLGASLIPATCQAENGEFLVCETKTTALRNFLVISLLSLIGLAEAIYLLYHKTEDGRFSVCIPIFAVSVSVLVLNCCYFLVADEYSDVWYYRGTLIFAEHPMLIGNVVAAAINSLALKPMSAGKPRETALNNVVTGRWSKI